METRKNNPSHFLLLLVLHLCGMYFNSCVNAQNLNFVSTGNSHGNYQQFTHSMTPAPSPSCGVDHSCPLHAYCSASTIQCVCDIGFQGKDCNEVCFALWLNAIYFSSRSMLVLLEGPLEWLSFYPFLSSSTLWTSGVKGGDIIFGSMSVCQFM